MRGDATRVMPEQILTILEAQAGRSEASAERVLDVVHTDLVQAHSRASFLPGGVQHLLDRRALEGEHVVLASRRRPQIRGVPCRNESFPPSSCAAARRKPS